MDNNNLFYTTQNWSFDGVGYFMTWSVTPENVLLDVYRRLLEYVNWGEALMTSVIEKAEQMRNCMDCKFVYDAKAEGSVGIPVNHPLA